MSTTQNASLQCRIKTQNNSVKRKTACFKLLVVVLSFALYTFTLNKTDASDLSLGIYPPIIQITLKPPATISTPIAIENRGDETVTLEILFKPFTSNEGESGEVAYLWDKNLNALWGKNPLIFQNIKVGKNGKTIEEIILAPRQKKTLALYLEIPKDEPSSDYYFSVVFISKNSLKDDLSHSQIRGAIATNVLLSIGAEKSMGKIIEFSAPFILPKGPVPFTIRLKNEGKHFITPEGSILIKNMFGQTIGELNLLPVNILAQTTRSQKTLWQESFLFGPYTASLTISLSDNGPILAKTIHFFVLPIKVFIGLTVGVFIIFLVKKRLKTH